MRKDPEAIQNLIQKLNLDVLCLQETKLQESHLDDPKVTLESKVWSFIACVTVASPPGHGLNMA